MLGFVLTWKKGVARIQFCHNTAKTPHVNRCCVWNTEDDFGCAVEPRLDVGVYALVLEAAAPVVDYLDSRFVWLLKENVLGFQITMDDCMVALELEGL